MSNDIQSAIEKARMVAAKITGQLPQEYSSNKRSADYSGDGSSKKFASVNDAVGAQLAMLKASQLGGTFTEEMKVPDKLVGLVIGRGGEQLHRLQAETQCKVQIAPADNNNSSTDRIFTLVGNRESIDKARKSIEEILKRSSSWGSDPSSQTSVVLQRGNMEIVEIKIPGNKCGLVIGKGGETIKRLIETYGVKLVVVQDNNAPSNGDKPLRITGEADKVSKAKEAIMALINPGPKDKYSTNDYGSRSHSSGNTEAYIKVPGEKAGVVIGKGGESIKEINRRSGAHVEIDKSQRGSNTNDDKMFILRGTNEQIQYAQQLIYEKITGVQGSQPPAGYFNPGESDSSYGAVSSSRNGDSSSSSYQQQWGMAYSQGWPQAADTKAAADPWAAYYQQLYGQAGAQPAAPQASATSAPAVPAGAAAASQQPSINPQTGQPDYSQAWIEYYRSLGMYEQADAILRQTQQGQQNGAGAPQSSSSSVPNGSSASQSQSSAAASSQQNGSSAAAAAAGGYAGWPGYAGYNYSGYYKQDGTNGQ